MKIEETIALFIGSFIIGFFTSTLCIALWLVFLFYYRTTLKNVS